MFIFACIIGVIVFCAIYFGVKNSYAQEGTARSYPFEEQSTPHFVVNTDRFVREYTTHVRRPKAEGGGHGGHGGGPRGGGGHRGGGGRR